MTAEHIIQNQIRVAVSQENCRVFRTNVGKVRMPDGRWFDTGLPKGFPDLMGFRLSDKQIFFIEVKNETGKPRPEQVRFHEFLMAHEVIHGLCRSADDAVRVVKGGLIGYGWQDRS